MPAFSYSAIDKNGIKKKGILSADSERDARKIIKDLNLIPITVNINLNKTKDPNVKNKDLVIVTRQLATLLEANTPIVDALNITANQLNSNLSYILYDLKEDIVQGKRLGNSMKKYPKIFSDTYISLISAGDSSGNLDKVFLKLADYLEESEAAKQKIKSALTYPLILICFSTLIIISLLYFVLPSVVGQFVKAGAELPLLTKVLLYFSNNIILILLSLSVLLISIFYTFKNYTKNKDNLIKVHKRILNLPFFGKFIMNSELERFSNTMNLLLESGMNLDSALVEGSKVFNNKFLSDTFVNIKKDVVEGKDFAMLLKKELLLPEIFIQLISSGYKSGNLISMFLKVKEFLNREIDAQKSMFLSLVEPLVIVLMGGFVMLIVLAILIPIMQMNTIVLG
tara:strand:+ start:878 stop:2068 length:1191 start_codon:yes stop_codon:yes gene_type:complete